jgi:hypothetical protein
MPRTAAERQNSQDSLPKRPVRLVTYAWGDQYVDELLSLTLPAVLAPNNLPAIVRLAPSEVVVLIQEQHYRQVASHPIVAAIRQLCSVRVVGLDDLIVSKDKYGMTLTYALHRGIHAFGVDVTETYFLFLNADFIISDGSLRNALLALMQGERVVASPSYCVVSNDARPELRAFTDPKTGMVAIPPRALARLALRHLHSTVRGKTLNQSDFHLAQMDQFYWRVDNDTLLGHQMPVAIVGMRPERAVDEPNSYWDHGLIAEFCPDAKPYMLGDSDDFLMVELRERDVAAEQIVTGPLDPRKVAESMIGWVTPYQRAFAELPLTLHAENVPPAASAERGKLAAQVAGIFSYAPRIFPSHRNHPQWNYHHGAFMAARHQRLSLQLGIATAKQAPPPNLTPVDQAWWRLDGARKRAARHRVASECVREKCPSIGVFFEEQLVALADSHPALEREIVALEMCYAKLVRMDVTSAVVPHVRYDPEQPLPPRHDYLPQGIASALRRHLRLAGYQSSLRHARSAISKAVATGAQDMLVVTADMRLIEELMPRLDGLHASVSSVGVQSGNLAYALDPTSKFDLCLWELSPDDLLKWQDRIASIQFCLKPGATVVGFCAVSRGATLSIESLASGYGFTSEVHVDRTSIVALLRLVSRGLAKHGRGLAKLGLIYAIKLVAQRRRAKRLAVQPLVAPGSTPLLVATTVITHVLHSATALMPEEVPDSVVHVVGSDQQCTHRPERVGASARARPA